MERLSFVRLLSMLALVLICFSGRTEAEVERLYVYPQDDPKSPNKWIVKDTYEEGTPPVASASFSNQINATGWSYLRVVTNEDFPDEDQAYAAGLLEGRLTCQLMKYRWTNAFADLCSGSERVRFCDYLMRHLQDNLRYMERRRSDSVNFYWHQVSLILRQLEGLEHGCEVTTAEENDHDVMRRYPFLLMSLWPETWDLDSAFKNRTFEDGLPESCSALIKWTLGGDDGVGAELYVGHATWFPYSEMIRILKNYEFHYHFKNVLGSRLIPGYNMTFSSYPGALHSVDDFILISSGLVALETTNSNYNGKLWKYISPENSVPEFIRSMLASRLAHNGYQWTMLFSVQNSGTYNNQWMIIDYNKFECNSSELESGLLWVIEEMPGTTMSRDLTNILRSQGYWPSYNIPYFPYIYKYSGYPQMVEEYGPYYSYEDNARARIFKRDQDKVVDLDSMVKLLRSNDYLHDPLSVCNCTPPYSAFLALSARGDLNSLFGSYNPPSIGHSSFGATDVKVTSYELFQTLQFVAISGPTYDSVPPFQWSTYILGDYVWHVGMPDRWEFGPVLTTWE